MGHVGHRHIGAVSWCGQPQDQAEGSPATEANEMQKWGTKWDAEHRPTIPYTESMTCERFFHPWSSLAPVISPHISVDFTFSVFITFMTPAPFLWVDNLKRDIWVVCSRYHCHLTVPVSGSRGIAVWRSLPSHWSRMDLSGNLSERMSNNRFYELDII